MATAMRGRSLRLKGRRISVEDHVVIDLNKAPSENIREILVNIVKKRGISKGKRLSYLNNVVRLCKNVKCGVEWGFSVEEILICLRVALVSCEKEIRAAAIRAICHLLDNENILDCVLKLHLDYYFARSLDMYIENEVERIQTIKLVRKIIQIAAWKVPSSLVFPLVAICFGGTSERDPMFRVGIQTVCELAVYNANVAAQCGAIRLIIHSILDFHMLPRINESLVMTMLFLLNHPKSRRYIKTDIDLEYVLTPFTDCYVKMKKTENTGMDEVGKRLLASKLALVTIFRSWPGMIRLCRPDGSGLQSLFGALYLSNMDTRKAIIDLIFDIFYIPFPQWTDDFSEALLSIDSTRMKESWDLRKDFVAQEGFDLLPHRAKFRMNLVENHLALLLLSFITAGLFEALVEVITTSSKHVCIRATLLLGELLNMASKSLPHDCCQHSHTLPSLVSIATSFDVSPTIRDQASIAVNILNIIHNLKRRGNLPYSLYMENIMQQAHDIEEDKSRTLRIAKEKLSQYVRTQESSDLIDKIIKDTQVLTSIDSSEWNWELIAATLKWPDDTLKTLSDQSHLRFIRRLMIFYKPSKGVFAKIPQKDEHSKLFAKVGCLLVDFLLQCDEAESDVILKELLDDISICLSEVRQEEAPYDRILSPRSVCTDMSRDYFLLLGRFSYSKRGERVLERTGVVQLLIDLVTVTSHDVYIKLIISSLNYTRDSLSRLILTKALTATSESARLYAAKFMRVLLRAEVPFISTWGMELLVTQLYDENVTVAMEALSVIEEACEDEVNLNTAIKLRPSLLHLKENGALLLARFLSLPNGFKYLNDAKYVQNELERWRKGFNERYVGIVEEKLHKALTSYEEKYYILYASDECKSPSGKERKDVFVPVHLYGQLVQHKTGYRLLRNQTYLSDYFDTIRFQYAYCDEEILALKTALWAVGHIGSSQWGVLILQDENIVPDIIKLAEESSIFSIRGTAYYTLGLIASTHQGSNTLQQYGWESLHHSRANPWPVHDECDDYDTESFHKSDSDPLLLRKIPSNIPSSSDEKELNGSLTDSVDQHKSSSQSSAGSSEDDSKLHTSLSSSGRWNQPLLSLTSIDEHDVTPYNDKDCRVGSKNNDELSVFPSSPRKANSFAGTMNISDALHERSVSEPVKRTYSPSLNNAVENQLVFRRVTAQKVQLEQRPRSSSNEETRVSFNLDSTRPASLSLGNTDESDPTNRMIGPNDTKIRSDSTNTDATTSGIGSSDSESPMHSSSLSQFDSSSGSGSKHSKEQTQPHHSELARRRANLKKMPSLHLPQTVALSTVTGIKQMDYEPPPLSPFGHSKDASSFATLKTLRRQRTYSSEKDSDFDLQPFFDDRPNLRAKRRFSIEVDSIRPMSLSVSEADLKNYSSKNDLKFVLSHGVKKRPMVAGTAEFVGLALPVDVGLIFHVTEEEYRSQNTSDVLRFMDQRNKGRSPWGDDNSDNMNDTGLEIHDDNNCLGCYRLYNPDISAKVLTLSECETDEGDGISCSRPMYYNSGKVDPPDIVTGSAKSGRSIDSYLSGREEYSLAGHATIRKEIIRFIVNLSGTIGAEKSEKALLLRKQSHKWAFTDICLYSEVCYLLSHYSFQLGARRFIQELFDEVSFDVIYEDPMLILGLQNDIE